MQYLQYLAAANQAGPAKNVLLMMLNNSITRKYL